MTPQELLMIPGPTPVPPATLLEMARPMFNHRGPEFARLLAEVQDGLRYAFSTQSEVFVLTCSGSGGMEAAVVNTLSPGDRALILVHGMFGRRFAVIARAYGAEVDDVEVEWGVAPTGDLLRRKLEEDGERRIQAIFVTHNDTSTAVQSDIEEIARARGDHPALLVVDAVSSLGAAPLKMDEWGVDVVVSASQKTFAAPPGLAFVAMSPKALERMEMARMPRFYLDLRQARQFARQGQTPFTPAVSQIRTLARALQSMREEGLENVIQRHIALAAQCRAGLEALGFRIYADPRFASNTVTAAYLPEGVDAKELRDRLRVEHGIIIGAGQGPLEPKVIRVGHLGVVSHRDIATTLDAIKQLLSTPKPQPVAARK